MSNSTIVPRDIWNLICEFLPPTDIIYLGVSCTSMYKILESNLLNLQKEHELFHQCTDEIENVWNMLATQAEHKAKLNLDRFKSSVCYGWEVKEDYDLKCSIYPEKYHDLKVVYVYNPRDVDMTVWFLDNQRMGWTMS